MRNRRPRAWPRPRPGAAVAGAAVALVAVLAAGCASLPSSGTAQAAPGRLALGDSGGGCCALIVRGPKAGWSPDQVVNSFLLASSVFAHGFSLAREYLTAGASRSWRPGSGATILTGIKVSQQSGRVSGPQGQKTVVVTGQELATLTSGGQYVTPPAGDSAAPPEDFTLKLVNGVYQIDSLPANGLLLTDYLFHLVYTPRDLYYYGLRNSQLVPDSVFIPTVSTSPAVTLIDGLRRDPTGLLQDAATTAFPPGAQLKQVQAVPGKTAIVSIHLPAGNDQSTVLAMARQLVATLTSPDYGSRLFEAVKLKVNGRTWAPRGDGPVLTLATRGLHLRYPAGKDTAYYLTSAGAAGTIRSDGHVSPVPGEGGTGRPPLSSVAVSPDGRYLAAIAGPATTVYTGDLATASGRGARSQPGQLTSRLTGSGFTGLSWDNEDDLWVAGEVGRSPGLWVLPPGQGGAIKVSLPSGLGPVTGVRVAPDGVRVALIVGLGSSAHLELAAIMRDGSGFSLTSAAPLGPNLSAVSSLTWFGEDNLIAIAKPGSAGAELWEVPVDGDSATSLQWQQPGMTSITADGPGNLLYLSLANGRLEKSVGLGEPWSNVTAGQDAVYPG
jgi:WD40 repeat protein